MHTKCNTYESIFDDTFCILLIGLKVSIYTHYFDRFWRLTPRKRATKEDGEFRKSNTSGLCGEMERYERERERERERSSNRKTVKTRKHAFKFIINHVQRRKCLVLISAQYPMI